MGHPDSRATTKAEFMLNQVSFVEHFTKTNGTENTLSMLYGVLVQRLDNGLEVKCLVFIPHKVAEICTVDGRTFGISHFEK